MKKKLLFCLLIIMAVIGHAQVWTAIPTTTMATSSNVRIGAVGTSAATLHVGGGTGNLHWNNNGVLIKFNTGDRALLELHDPSGTNRTVFQSLAGATWLSATGTLPLYLQTTGGPTAIGNTNPQYKLDVHTATANDGINITQTTAHAAALHITNTTAGGRHWAIFSTGSGNTQGAGHFTVYDYNSGADRLFINGTSGNVGIGTVAPVNAQLEVKHVNQQSGFTRAIYGNGYNASGSTFWNAGVEGVGGDVCLNGQNYGIRGRAYNGQAMGGYFEARLLPGCSGFAAGIYSGGDSYAAYLGGNVHITSNLTGPSDVMLKENITPLDKMMAKIKLLKPSHFTFKTSAYADMHLPAGDQMGLIAQELETVFPALVQTAAAIHSTDADGTVLTDIPSHKTVNYLQLIPVLIAGMQEQQQQIEQLQAQIQAMGGRVAPVSTGPATENAVVLNQNVPNPFAESTLISFNIPAPTKLAQLQISTVDGKPVKTVRIGQTGPGTIRVYGSGLGKGVYTYSLLADGKVLETKKMVKE